ncbi:Glu/Leu/Phe/Val dehydrogenase dimerization domain-containing protein [Cupriavidus sp. 30B13]|uniref:Glu/Leu/Phe/Val dehydrogenase dimerization domain-containing protein n=1 Tax=Cupriavidus sp. 30B13 TaxID=3384241 RepID=UPI003B8EFEDB
MHAIQIPTDHEHVQVKPGRRTGLPVMIGIHSTTLGPAIGGLRIKHYDTPSEGLADCLRLSHAMTYKAAAIDNGTGGGKSVVPLPAGASVTRALKEAILLDVAEQIHDLQGAYMAGPDVGTGPEDMDFIFRRTPWAGGRSKAAGGAGGTTEGTFAGLESAIEAAAEVALGASSVSGLRIAIVGLGGIGTLLARALKAKGASLLLADIDPAREALARELGATWCAPHDAMLAECDVLAPCALGGVVTPEVAGQLRCRVICGAANNILSHDAVAAQLRARGIDYVPDFIANAGGLKYASAVEVHRQAPAEAMRGTCRGIAENVRTVLRGCWDGAGTSVELALALGQRRLDAALARPARPGPAQMQAARG